jgi:hypothetical protein
VRVCCVVLSMRLTKIANKCVDEGNQGGEKLCFFF